jgi:hypothetical protein
MRRLIELSRFAVAVPAVTSIIASFVLMAIGVWEVVMTIVHLLDSSVSVKLTVVAILTAVDTFLLATVLLVIGYGLYELFVDSEVKLPEWLEIRSLDDLIASTGWPSDSFCTACFTGDYPLPVGELSGKHIMEKKTARDGFFAAGSPELFDSLPG